jgi:hypothetical protein
MNNKSLLNAVVEGNLSDDALSVLNSNLLKTGLLNTSPTMGDDDVKNVTVRGINESNGDDAKTIATINGTAGDLENIYLHQRGRADKMFYLFLITIALFILLILIGVVVIFIEESQNKFGIISSISGLVSGLISGLLFNAYKNEDKNARSIERDLRKIDKLKRFLATIQNMPEDHRITAYDAIIKELKFK